MFDSIQKYCLEKVRKIKAPFKRCALKRNDFTIISNNCWGGIVYEAYGLPKNTPTVGCYFFADDYLKFVSNLQYYLSIEIKMISVSQSKHQDDILKLNDDLNIPIGLLDDIEIVFLHYKTPELAKEKWLRRVKRVNYNNLIFKFSYQNNCTDEHLDAFDKMELKGKKIMFVHRKDLMRHCTVFYPGFENEKQLLNDTRHWDKYLDVTAFLNS